MTESTARMSGPIRALSWSKIYCAAAMQKGEMLGGARSSVKATTFLVSCLVPLPSAPAQLWATLGRLHEAQGD